MLFGPKGGLFAKILLFGPDLGREREEGGGLIETNLRVICGI